HRRAGYPGARPAPVREAHRQPSGSLDGIDVQGNPQFAGGGAEVFNAAHAADLRVGQAHGDQRGVRGEELPGATIEVATGTVDGQVVHGEAVDAAQVVHAGEHGGVLRLRGHNPPPARIGERASDDAEVVRLRPAGGENHAVFRDA